MSAKLLGEREAFRKRMGKKAAADTLEATFMAALEATSNMCAYDPFVLL